MALKAAYSFTRTNDRNNRNADGLRLFNYVRDESVDMDRTEVDASSRASVTFRQFVPGLSNGNVETQIMHLPGDTIFDAIQNAFFNNTILLMAFVDGPLQAGDEDATKPTQSAFLVCGCVLRHKLYRTAGVGRCTGSRHPFQPNA